MEIVSRKAATSSSSQLAPGFRFHPTDEELVRYYLRRKVCGKPLRFDAISDVDIYKVEPWDLPNMSRLQTRDLEWYFFSVLDKKNGNGSRTNRATDRGYWKTTGKDRPVFHNSKETGMKKTLVYHNGRAPHGERTNWVMHEYRLVDEELERAGFSLDSFVLCRIFRKSGAGPKNGERYGAPFVEEEWEDDDMVMFPKEKCAKEVTVVDDVFLDVDDLQQTLGAVAPEFDAPLPLNCYSSEGHCVDVSTDVVDCIPKFLQVTGETYPKEEQPDEPKFLDLPLQNEVDANTVKHECLCDVSNDGNAAAGDFLFDDLFFDAIEDASPNDGGFLEANDLNTNPEADTGFDMLNGYLSYTNDFTYAADDWQCNFDPAVGSENLPESASFFTENVGDSNLQWTNGNQQLHEGATYGVDSSSAPEKVVPVVGSDNYYPFIKGATRMLGNIPAPQAFAAEFPSKEALRYLSSISSSPASVAAGAIQLRNLTFSGTGFEWSSGKPGHVNIVLSLGLLESDVELVDSSKTSSATFRCWLCCIFMWIMVLSMSFKMGSYLRRWSFSS